MITNPQARGPAVVVVGAGIAGLAAAWSLHRAGIQVRVLERDSRVGGRIRTETIDDFAVDVGAQFITNFSSHTLRLIREFGLRDQLVRICGDGAVVRDGRLYPFWPRRSALFNGLISPRGRLALLRLVWPVVRHWNELDLHEPHRAHRLDTQPVLGDPWRRPLPDEVAEYVVEPPLGGFLYSTPERTSQAMQFLLVKAGLGLRELLTLRHGLGRLPETMAARLRVDLGTEVRSVRTNHSGRYNLTLREDGHERHLTADAVVCATTASQALALFEDLGHRQRSFFESFSYAASAVTVIAVRGRLPSRYFVTLLPRSESPNLAAVTVESAKHQASVPPSRDLLLLYPSGSASWRLLGQSDAAIREELVAELSALGPAYQVGDRALFSRVYRWDQGLPEFDVGHFRRLQTFADGAIEWDRVVFAGDYLGGPLVEGAVTSGLQAADRLVRRLRAR
jgi:oxygen-dependent protoporphyrinogen oxidase